MAAPRPRARLHPIKPPGGRPKALPTWTDAEVLALVDAVLIARDTQVARSMFHVLNSRPGSERGNCLSHLKGVDRVVLAFSVPEIQDVGPTGSSFDASERIQRLLNDVERDPAARRELKQVVATIGKELARGRAKLEAYRNRHKVSG